MNSTSLAQPTAVVRHEWQIMAAARCQDPSITLRALGDLVGRSPQTVASWDRNPVYKTYEAGIVKDVAAQIPVTARGAKASVKEFFQEYATEMQNRLLDILEDTPDNKLQVAIAQDWLDRAGYSGQDKAKGITISLPAKAIEALFNRAAEAGLRPPTIDVTPA
jgi:hypothetical protein